LQECRRAPEREANNVGVTALPGLHEGSGSALDGIGSGFIHWFTGGNIVLDSCGREPAEAHQSLHHIETHQVPCVVEDGYSRHDRVRLTAEAGEHLPRVIRIARFAEDVVLQDNDRIRAEYDRSRALAGNMLGFRICYSPGISPGHFTGQDTFIDIGRKHCERDGELRQQFSTPW
jgi:hypothetical protein